MKKIFFMALSLFLVFSPKVFGAQTENIFVSTGEVVSVDPVYSRITIDHGAIKGFAHDGPTEFVAASKDLLSNILKSDLIEFEIKEKNGNAEITKITRLGRVEKSGNQMSLGQAAQGVLEGAGDVVKTVTSPIAPVGEVAGTAADATTGATGTVLNEAKTEIKQKF